MSILPKTFHPSTSRHKAATLALCALALACAATPLAASTTEPLTATPQAATHHELPGEQTDVFVSGRGGYHTYRIPAVAVTTSGTVLAFCEGRRNSSADQGEIHLLLKRSLDGGRTWGAAQIVYAEPGKITIGNPVPIIDAQRQQVWLVFCRNNRRVFATRSTDDGFSWSRPEEITTSVLKAGWGPWVATGPCHGLQLSNGRLVVPTNHQLTPKDPTSTGVQKVTSANAIFSDDHGKTWKTGEAVGELTNEATMAARADGTLVVNARSYHGKHRRAVAESPDGGQTWSPIVLDQALIEPVCQASLLSASDKAGRELFLFSNPASEKRERMTIRLSEDGGCSWRYSQLLYGGSAAYSDLCDLGNETFGCLYERDRHKRLTFARFTLQWLREAPGQETKGGGK